MWVWEYPLEEGHHDMFMDPGEQIRFRVVSQTFTGEIYWLSSMLAVPDFIKEESSLVIYVPTYFKLCFMFFFYIREK